MVHSAVGGASASSLDDVLDRVLREGEDRKAIKHKLSKTISGRSLLIDLDVMRAKVVGKYEKRPNLKKMEGGRVLSDFSFVDWYSSVSFFWDGLRENRLFQIYALAAEKDDVLECSDERLIRLFSSPFKGIPYEVMEDVFMHNLLQWAALLDPPDPSITLSVTTETHRHVRDVDQSTAFSIPENIVALTHVLSERFNTVLDMRHVDLGGPEPGASVQMGEYSVRNSLWDEWFTQGMMSVSPLVSSIPIFGWRAKPFKHVATHSQSRVEDTVDRLNTYFGTGYELRRDGTSVFLDGKYFGRYVRLLDPQRPVDRGWGYDLETLEHALAPQVAGGSTSRNFGVLSNYSQQLDPRLIGMPGLQVGLLCELDEDLKLHGKRIFRRGVFYNCPACFDHYYYKPTNRFWRAFSRKAARVVLAGKIDEANQAYSARMGQSLVERSRLVTERVESQLETMGARVSEAEAARRAAEADAEVERLTATQEAAFVERKRVKKKAHDGKNLANPLTINAFRCLRDSLSSYLGDLVLIAGDRYNDDGFLYDGLDYLVSAPTNEVPSNIKKDAFNCQQAVKLRDLLEDLMAGTERKGKFVIIDYKGFIDEIVAHLSPRGHAQIINQVPEHIYVNVERDVLMAAMLNLVDNAAEASVRGKVFITAEENPYTLSGKSDLVKTIITQSGDLDAKLAVKLTDGLEVPSSKKDGHSIGAIASHEMITGGLGGLIRYITNGPTKGARVEVYLPGLNDDLFYKVSEIGGPQAYYADLEREAKRK
ncbi:HAMP domain-containing histidine kinase [Candidatus Woesearchaeota archaeon]|jgi:hypothetical protein|nr:HAMP domain-containing histidine kinase [Candidatus Woesearchaeota archaeon]MBT3537013.1 HAMP domain-containing histidine kinase [Candidatus Woesearchaeota archaeon]MBT4697623.1 HAMP domain-containing histidine kinase [Candidatus Woesearchaeota archaeon]MBT4716508.1 HAMP domain-containing histidine kinase [Candidatus Woesearchaeota archaeon]MBT7106677.1 HAMP domain-containing histidine kinase [Candidatus Woesearchaeota archaeon]